MQGQQVKEQVQSSRSSDQGGQGGRLGPGFAVEQWCSGEQET